MLEHTSSKATSGDGSGSSGGGGSGGCNWGGGGVSDVGKGVETVMFWHTHGDVSDVLAVDCGGDAVRAPSAIRDSMPPEFSEYTSLLFSSGEFANSDL